MNAAIFKFKLTFYFNGKILTVNYFLETLKNPR